MGSEILDKIAKRIKAHRTAPPEESWTANILERGTAFAARKLGEESIETIIEALEGNKERLAEESADLLYHWLVLMEACQLSPDDVYAVLERRFNERK
jgi:phosphoribosyl-ATP pyrophosphohydrolase